MIKLGVSGPREAASAVVPPSLAGNIGLSDSLGGRDTEVALELLYEDFSSHNTNRAFAVRQLPGKVGIIDAPD
jgi:hypothetical protein